MRWLFTFATLVCLIAGFSSSSPLWMGLGLLFAILFSIAAVFAFAQVRIDAHSPQDPLSDAQVAAMQAAVRKKKQQERQQKQQPHEQQSGHPDAGNG